MKCSVVGWLWAPVIALQFLTRIPIGFIPDSAYDDADGRRKALIFYPAVGLVVGSIGACVLLVSRRLILPPYAAAILSVVATALVTGAFHEDGLADTADGLGPHNREDALRVMRDSRIGTFGAIALWTLLSLKAVALAGLPGHLALRTMIAAHVLARWTPLPLSAALPYAQSTAGIGGQMAAAVDRRVVVLGSLLTFAIVIPLLGPAQAARWIAAAVVIIVLTGAFYQRRFGGITGDCLGATNQIAEVTCLLLTH